MVDSSGQVLTIATLFANWSCHIDYKQAVLGFTNWHQALRGTLLSFQFL